MKPSSISYGIPSLYRKSLKASGDAYAVSYELPEAGQCLHVHNRKVCVGTDTGFLLMKPFAPSAEVSRALPTPFQQNHVYELSHYDTGTSLHKLCFNDRFLVYANLDATVGVFDHINNTTTSLSLTQGKLINDLCLNDDGLAAVVGDDNRLVITDLITQKQHFHPLMGNPSVVRFRPHHPDQVMLVENTQTVKIINWQTGKTVYSLLTGQAIHDIVAHGDTLTVFTATSIKRYDLNNLQGGLGETYANLECVIAPVRDGAKYMRGGALSGILGLQSASLYDSQKLQRVVQVDVSLPSTEINDCMVSDEERMVVAVCGKRLLLIDVSRG